MGVPTAAFCATHLVPVSTTKLLQRRRRTAPASFRTAQNWTGYKAPNTTVSTAAPAWPRTTAWGQPTKSACRCTCQPRQFYEVPNGARGRVTSPCSSAWCGGQSRPGTRSTPQRLAAAEPLPVEPPGRRPIALPLPGWRSPTAGTRATRSTSCPARSGCTSRSRSGTTAYPSELGHALRRQHGANKPPRLMARLIEFFTKPGELVLDPFAGVGGTLLGAAIARAPRRALGIEIEPRWAAVYDDVVREAARGARRRWGRSSPTSGRPIPAGLATFDPTRLRSFESATPWCCCRNSERRPWTSSRPIRRTTCSCR